ncbi:unnamed protein product [Aphanomyces euteiches]
MEILRNEILSEIQTLVHVFRQDYVKIKSTQLQGLASLRVQVYQWAEPADFESQTVLRPFLDIVRNENTTGPLTRTAMESVCNILRAYEHQTSIFAPVVAMHHAFVEAIDAVTQCRFQETDPESDQYVLLMVVRVLDVVIQCRAVDGLPVDSKWRIFESLFGISRSYEARLSSVLRSLATETLHHLVRALFVPQTIGADAQLATKILGFLCQKVQAKSQATERETIVALNLLHSILHASGAALAQEPSLLAHIHDDLCGALLILCRLSDISIPILMASLPLWRLLWVHLRMHLKLQWEELVLGLLGALQDPNLTWEWKLELAQLVVDLLSDAAFALDMYVNYDCDPDRSNVLECILDVLLSTETMLSTSTDKVSTEEMIELSCLGLVNALQMLYQRTQHTEWPENASIGATQLLERRQRKQVFQEAINLFNKKPLQGLAMLESHGFIESPMTPVVVAQFLRSLPRGMDKNTVGQMLGGLGKASGGNANESVEFQSELRRAYVETFDLDQLALVDALRLFLSAFRLPGEAQQIDRILEAFAERVYAQCRERDLFGCVDVAYLLSFSIIMLNTDLHNPNIRPEKKMSLPDFLKNNTHYGLNNQLAPLPEDYLTTIYHAIATDQFRTFEEHQEMTFARSVDAPNLLCTHFQLDGMNYNVNSAQQQTRRSTASPMCMIMTVKCLIVLQNAYLTPPLNLLFESPNRNLRDLAMQLVVLTGLVASALQCEQVLQNVVKLLAETSTLVDAIDADETIDGAEYAFTNDALACAAAQGLLEVWTQCANMFRSQAWLYLNAVVCRLREFRLVPHNLLRHRPNFRSVHETTQFVATVRRQAITKRTSYKKAAATSSSSSTFFHTMTRFFTEAPLSDSMDDVQITNPQLAIDDLYFDITDTTMSPEMEWTRPLVSYYEHMHPLSDAAFLTFCETAWTEIERVVLPPSKTKPKVPVLSPGGAVFLEQLVLQCIAHNQDSTKVNERLWKHAHLLLNCMDPLIRGNLQVQGMAYDNAVFLVDTLVMGLITLERDSISHLNQLLAAHRYLVPLVAQPLLRGLCQISTSSLDQLELVHAVIPVEPAWIPELVELLAKWMHSLDEAPQLRPNLIYLVFTWGLFPVHADEAIGAQAMKYAVQLYIRSNSSPSDALQIVGGLLSLRFHPKNDIRLASAQAIKQCLLEVDVSFPPSTWLSVLRFGFQGEMKDAVTPVDSEDWAVLATFQMPQVDPLPPTVGRLQILAQVFLHRLDALKPCADFEILWSELLAAFQTHLDHTSTAEEARELLRNVVLVVQATSSTEVWFEKSIPELTVHFPDLGGVVPAEPQERENVS